MHLSRYAASVTMVVRKASLASSMSDYLIQRIDATPNITVQGHCEVIEASGSTVLERLTLLDNQTGTTETLDAAALFVMIGAEPHTDWLDGALARDEQGYVLTGSDLLDSGELEFFGPFGRAPPLLETSIPGVFAAGDVRARSVKRVASAVGEGATAVQLVTATLRSGARPVDGPCYHESHAPSANRIAA